MNHLIAVVVDSPLKCPQIAKTLLDMSTKPHIVQALGAHGSRTQHLHSLKTPKQMQLEEKPAEPPALHLFREIKRADLDRKLRRQHASVHTPDPWPGWPGPRNDKHHSSVSLEVAFHLRVSFEGSIKWVQTSHHQELDRRI